jgi:hypothetical protein
LVQSASLVQSRLHHTLSHTPDEHCVSVEQTEPSAPVPVVGQPVQAPHAVPALLQVSVPVPPLEQVQDSVVFGVQTSVAGHMLLSQSQLVPEHVALVEPVEEPVMQLPVAHQPHAAWAVQIAQVAYAKQGSATQPVQAPQAFPALLQVCVPISSSTHAQVCVEPAVQEVVVVQPPQVPHELPLLLHVCVPVPPVVQVQASVVPGVHTQSLQAPQAVPPLLQVSTPVPPVEQVQD